MPLFRKTHLDDDDIALGAELLLGNRAIAPVMELSEEEARLVVSYMRLIKFKEGDVLVQQGEGGELVAPSGEGETQLGSPSFLLLLLRGEVAVEQLVVSRVEPFVMSMLQPGALIGEMSIIDGSPRAATCTASTDVRAAKLSRNAFMALLRDKPKIGVKLLLIFAQRLSANLRDSSQKIFLYAQLVQTMDEEIAEKISNTAASD
jgi:CRP/FNR family transcriptional regulator, cyclic AMP receptor protein